MKPKLIRSRLESAKAQGLEVVVKTDLWEDLVGTVVSLDAPSIVSYVGVDVGDGFVFRAVSDITEVEFADISLAGPALYAEQSEEEMLADPSKRPPVVIEFEYGGRNRLVWQPPRPGFPGGSVEFESFEGHDALGGERWVDLESNFTTDDGDEVSVAEWVQAVLEGAGVIPKVEVPQ